MQIKLVQISLKCWVIIGSIIYRVILVLQACRSTVKCRKASAVIYDPHCTICTSPLHCTTALHCTVCTYEYIYRYIRTKKRSF